MRCARFAIALTALLGCVPAYAYIGIGNRYVEPVDAGATYATVYPSYPDEADCLHAPQLFVEGDEYTISIRRHVAGDPYTQSCAQTPTVDLGVLRAGWYRVVLRVFDGDGVTLVERSEREFRVRPLAGSCALDPELVPQIYVEHPTMRASQFAQRVASDPAYAASLGSPLAVRSADYAADVRTMWLTYPPLDDPVARRVMLESTHEFSYVSTNGRGCFATPPADGLGDVIEFYHRGLDHYFYTLNAAEIAALDDGSVIKGWARTGKSFRVVAFPGCPFRRNDVPAYRFYGKPGVGPDTHVFTIDREECFGVNANGLWIYESSPFWATTLKRDGSCANTKDILLYRVWRPFGVSNHRFTTDRAVVDEMVARGWIDEGARMCVLAH